MKDDSGLKSPIDQGHLSLEQVGFYNLNGYLSVPHGISDKEADALLKFAEGRADENFSAIMNLHREIPEFMRLMTDPRLLSMVETLQGKKVCGLMTQVLFKRPGSQYASQAWNPHQDNSYAKAKSGAYVTMNFSLADSDPENGGLYVYPGSHREGTLPYEPRLSFREKAGSNPGNKVNLAEKKYKRVDVHAKKGDLLFIHGEIVHGSHPNVSATRSRPSIQVTYVNFGEPFWPGDPKRSDKRLVLLHDNYYDD